MSKEEKDRYEKARINLQNSILQLKELDSKSPLLAYAQEIYKQTQLQGKSAKTPGNMELEDLIDSMQVTDNTLTHFIKMHNQETKRLTLNQETIKSDMAACQKQVIKLRTNYSPKISPAKKIGGLLLGIAGVLMILASVAIAVTTYGAATPLSIAGIKLGISCIAAGAAAGATAAVSGLGLFSTRKPHAQKMIESIESLKNELDKNIPTDAKTKYGDN